MHKGWLNLNGKWYYFTPEGEMVTNQSMFVDDKVYNFAQDGSYILKYTHINNAQCTMHNAQCKYLLYKDISKKK